MNNIKPITSESDPSNNLVYFKKYISFDYVYDYLSSLGLDNYEEIISNIQAIRTNVRQLFFKEAYLDNNEIIPVYGVSEIGLLGEYYRKSDISRWYSFSKDIFNPTNEEARDFYKHIAEAVKNEFESFGLNGIKGMIDPYYFVRLVIFELLQERKN